MSGWIAVGAVVVLIAIGVAVINWLDGRRPPELENYRPISKEEWDQINPYK